MDKITEQKLKELELKQEREENVKRIIRDLCNVLNYGHQTEVTEAAFDALIRDHPTLQASFWRFIKSLATRYKDTPRVDLRNEAAVKLCADIAALKQGIPLI
tara:strand:- start:125 stop:430 length:306 start_codon:yes stop_codon:yes gene_type:complete